MAKKRGQKLWCTNNGWSNVSVYNAVEASTTASPLPASHGKFWNKYLVYVVNPLTENSADWKRSVSWRIVRQVAMRCSKIVSVLQC